VAPALPAQSFDSRRRLAGTRLGRYQVGPRIGVGGSAAVYLGRLTGPMSFERLVAIKVVHDHLSEETEFISQFLDEANLLVQLAHPNIVQVHELSRAGDTLFLAMEYLHGQPLSKLVSLLARRNERLDPVAVAWLGARVAEGLAFAHELKDEQGSPLGLVHRDVSPQNVFLTYAGDVKLIDFGIARAAGRIAQTTLGRVKGKFSYMAPEQVLGREFDHRADLFALGATLYEVAVGARLFAGIDESETLHKLLFEEVPDPCARVPDFPPELGRILRRALESEPDARYPNGRELARDLNAFVEASGVADPKALVVDALAARFAAERGQQQQAIESLRNEALEEHTERDVLAGRPSGVVPRLAEPAPKPRYWVYGLAGFGVVLVVGLGALALRPDPPPARSAEPAVAPVPTTITVEVTTQPDVRAKVLIGGAAADGKPARASVPRGDRAIDVEVSAEGFASAKLSVVPDRNHAVLVPLTKLPDPAPPPSASAGPAKHPNNAGKVPTAPTVKKNDPLVTQYPFGKKP
jgi:serine/threonine-protein kinase